MYYVGPVGPVIMIGLSPFPGVKEGIEFVYSNSLGVRLYAYNFKIKMCSMAVMFGSEVLEVSSQFFTLFIFLV